MRFKALIFTLLLALPIFSLGAEEFKPLPAALDGSMMPYDFSAVDSLPDIPDGYKPIYVGYVARHGARYLSSPKKVEKIKKALSEAQETGNLSTEGIDFLAYLSEIDRHTGDNWGLLSGVGIAEEKRLGHQMAEMLPELFKKGRVNTISTFVPRVVMTMYEFNHSLERNHKKLELYTSSGHQNDSLLYFFDAFKQYDAFRTDGEWQMVYDSFLSRNVSPAPAQRLFKGAKKSDLEWRKLTMEMYGVLQGNRAAGFEPPTTRWLSEEEYRQCYRASNLARYLRNTPNQLDPWCAPATAMLIDKITDDADSAIAAYLKSEKEINRSAEASQSHPAERVVLNGYFGHAETLLPLLAVMNIPGCFTPAISNYDNLDRQWQLQEIVPLGANLACIFLEKDGDIYVSVRHNGRNVAAYPGAPAIIPWSDLKDYWQTRLRAFSRPRARLL